MSASGRRDEDPLKKYWWVVLLVCGCVGAWIYAPMTAGTGSDSVQISKASAEQSLSSLDSADNPQGAPGQALPAPGEGAGGAYAHKSAQAETGSSLYHAPGSAAGAPITEDEARLAAADKASGGSASADSLAQAMQSVASGVKPPDHGWGNAQVRTGFSRPTAEFGQAGASRMGGEGSSSASMSTLVQKPFGTGGDPGLNLSPGGGLQGADKAAHGILRQATQNNQSLSGLDKARKTSLDALKGADERAMGMSGRSFDMSGGGGSAQGQLASAAAGAGAGLNDGADVPANLKASDPSMNQKKLEPPKIDKAAEVKDDSNKQYMQQQILMMIMGVAISGIMGPMFSGVGMALASGMGLSQPSSGWDNKVVKTGG